MNRIRLRLSPSHYLYLLLHLALAGIGFWLMTIRGVVAQGIGASLVATGLTGWVIFLYVYLNDDLRSRMRLLYRAGIDAVFSSRGTPIRGEYDTRLLEARRYIDILGFGQRALREDHEKDFTAWKARAKVRVLLIDPEFPSIKGSFSRQRDNEEGSGAGEIARDVQAFLDRTRPIWDDRFQVRLYRCLPTVSIFRIDDQILWGPYLVKQVSRNSPTLVVRNGGSLFEALNAHFEEIWENPNLSREPPK